MWNGELFLNAFALLHKLEDMIISPESEHQEEVDKEEWARREQETFGLDVVN